uniref:CAP-Gly domain-containing linker protein 2 n=1 Tax=Anthurium amnicola TaxID=1678845 RepID=A0A1D1XYX2_9ARAE
MAEPRCSCGCRRCCPAAAWPRSVKRRVGRAAEGDDGGGPSLLADVAARVGVDNEVAALREALAGHQQTVAELCAELEEERAASASAASEAMSMILRLQREKAEVQMEARQFKRFAEEKMAHDQRELLLLEDMVYKREQALHALSCEVHAYRHRLLSYDIDPDSLGGDAVPVSYDYPSLRCHDDCHIHRMDPSIDDDDDAGEYPPGEAPPWRKAQLQSLERRIHQLERTPSQASLVAEMEKGVVMGHSPRAKSPHEKQTEEFPLTVDGLSDFGGDDDSTSYRVYTVDAVHSAAPPAGVCEEEDQYHVGSPRDSMCREGGVGKTEEMDIKKLYSRLQALEADRESMRQAIISMRTEKAQLVLLKEIAQHLCRDVPPPPPPPPPARKLVKPSLRGRFSFMSAVKWIVSFVFRRKTTRRSKYMFGLSDHNIGLLLLLEKASVMQQRRYLSRIRN